MRLRSYWAYVQDMNGLYHLIGAAGGDIGAFKGLTFSKGFAMADKGDGTYVLYHYDGTALAEYSASRSPDFKATDDGRCVIVNLGNKTSNIIVVDDADTPSAPAQPSEAEAPAAEDGSWICPACRTAGNTGKFCPECGTPGPEQTVYECPACHYRPAEGQTPKFCPECGNKMPEK